MFVQQLTSTGQMKSSKCVGVDNFADPLTMHIPKDILVKHMTNMGIIDLNGDLVASVSEEHYERKAWKLATSSGGSRSQLKVLATLGYISGVAGTAVQVRSRDYEMVKDNVVIGVPWIGIVFWMLFCLYIGLHLLFDMVKFKNVLLGFCRRQWRRDLFLDVGVQTESDEPPTNFIWTAEGGEKYHYSSDCVGLNNANKKLCRGLCLRCALLRQKSMT